MSELAYDREANAVFRERVRAWAEQALDEIRPRPSGDDAELVGSFLVGGNEAYANVILIEEREPAGLRSLHYDGYRTPVALQGDELLVHGEKVGRVYREYGGIVDAAGAPLSPKRLAAQVLAQLELGHEQSRRLEWFPSEDAFFAADTTRNGWEQWDCGSFDDGSGGRYRLTWLEGSREAFIVNHATGAVELLARSIDQQTLDPLYQRLLRSGGGPGDVEELRDALADWERAKPRLSPMSASEMPALADVAGPHSLDHRIG